MIQDEDILSTGVQTQDQEDGGVNSQSCLEDDEDSIAEVPENQSLHNSYHSDDELHPLHIDLEKDILSNEDDGSHNKTEHSRIMKCQDDTIGEGASFSPGEDSIARFQENSPLCNSYHTGDDELHRLHADLEKNILSKGDDASQNKTEHSRIMNSQDDPIDEGAFSSDEDAIARFPENLSVHKSYHSGNEELHHLHIDLEKNISAKGNDASQNKIEHSRVMNSQDDSISEETPFSSDGHAWPVVEMSHSYYDSAVTHDYTTDGLSLVNSQINEDNQTQIIGPESNLHQEETGKGLLHRQSDDPFGSYQSQDQIGLIQSLIKDKEVNSYHHEQKRAGLSFPASNNVPMGDGQYSSHFKESLQTLDQGQRQGGNVYVPENISGKIYSDAGRYLIPGQDPLSVGNTTGWAVSTPRMVAPSQSHGNTGAFIGQPWFATDHHVQGAWNGSGNGSLSSQSLGTGGNSDQSLFSVLSQCSHIRSGSSYESIRHTDQFLSPGNYGVVDAGTHRINAVVPPSSHPLDYFSGRDAPSALVPDDMTWISLPPQNPALNDQMGNSYLRSWNR